MRPRTRFTCKRFGLAIRQRRVQFGWSQEKFAENAGVHPTYVSAIESGKVSVGIKVANKLAKALDMRLSALIRLAE